MMAEGAVVSLWRYPVKSMMGEELNASDVTDRGLLGDRSLALVDTETGKVVSAKNPKKWSPMFDFRAAFSEPPQVGKPRRDASRSDASAPTSSCMPTTLTPGSWRATG
jgi:uncharacterized protein YcbX